MMEHWDRFYREAVQIQSMEKALSDLHKTGSAVGRSCSWWPLATPSNLNSSK